MNKINWNGKILKNNDTIIITGGFQFKNCKGCILKCTERTYYEGWDSTIKNLKIIKRGKKCDQNGNKYCIIYDQKFNIIQKKPWWKFWRKV